MAIIEGIDEINIRVCLLPLAISLWGSMPQW